MIVEAIQRYYPCWEAPADTRHWNRCLCPFHGDEIPSAAVSYEEDAFNCLSCAVRGDVIEIIRHEEGVSYAEAFRIAKNLSDGGRTPLQKQPAGKHRRRVFGEQGDSNRDIVRTGLRGRPTPWS